METTKVILNVPTLTVAHGRDVGGDLNDVHFLVLLIPGNPGIIEFYRDFLDQLWVELQETFPGETIPVWGISHAGHGTALPHPTPSLTGSPESYSLDGQIRHKEAFMKEFIPAHVRVILIGHSIGCHISLELIKSDLRPTPQVIQVLMLFPTIMDMKGTPNGRWFTSPFVRPLQWVPPTLLYPLDFTPRWFQNFLARVYSFFRPTGSSDCIKNGLVTILNRHVIQKVIHMANHEMDQVTSLDVDTLKLNSHRLYFYFGSSDGWCPMEFVSHMTGEVPELRHHVCTEGLPHAFVLGGSRRMASILIPKVTTLILPQGNGLTLTSMSTNP